MNILSHGQEYFPAFNIEGKVLISLNDFDFLRTEVFFKTSNFFLLSLRVFLFFFFLTKFRMQEKFKKKVLVPLSDFLVAASLCSEASMPINTV